MKKSILLIGIFLSSISVVFAVCKVPSEVVEAFNLKYPNATNVKWEKESVDEYEADFKWNGGDYSANYNGKGEWLETESITTFNQLPEKVQEAYTISHPGINPKEISKIETSQGPTTFEIEIRKGLKNQELIYSTDGILIKE